MNVCGNNVLKRVCAWIHHDLCVKSAVYQTHACVRLLYVTAVVFTLIAILKHQKKLLCFIQPRKRSLHIIQWWDVLTLRSVCISHCATLFRNDHRACVLKRNTPELLIHWKHNVSIYSLRHLLCNQLGFLYISPVLDWIGFDCWITGLKTFPEFSGLKWSDCKQRSDIGEKRFRIEIVFQ